MTTQLLLLSALIDLGADLVGLRTALSLDDAFRRFREESTAAEQERRQYLDDLDKLLDEVL